MLWPFLLEVFMNRLREIRVVKRVSQFKLRLSTGIHQSKISLIENGLVQPRDDEKQKIAKALGVGVGEIWGTEDENTGNIEG
jgi:transcriptional regulator with XRE-family HTH domain